MPFAHDGHATLTGLAVSAQHSPKRELTSFSIHKRTRQDARFDPVLSEEARRHYHDASRNQAGLEDYVRRLKSADALVVQFPVWCFGMPAMLKGFFDRMILPGVAFDISDPVNVKPMLGNLKHVAGIVTYGRPRWTAIAMGDPPRKTVKRYLRWFADRRARVDYHALYHMNVATDAQRAAFLEKIRAAMARMA